MKELSLLIDGSVDRISGGLRPCALLLENFEQLFLSSNSPGQVNPKSPSGFLGLTSQDSWSFLILPLSTDFTFE